jgi:hypothetical protein
MGRTSLASQRFYQYVICKHHDPCHFVPAKILLDCRVVELWGRRWKPSITLCTEGLACNERETSASIKGLLGVRLFNFVAVIPNKKRVWAYQGIRSWQIPNSFP